MPITPEEIQSIVDKCTVIGDKVSALRNVAVGAKTTLLGMQSLNSSPTSTQEGAWLGVFQAAKADIQVALSGLP